MTERVNVQAEETWCSIAVAAGFINCRGLRAFPANAAFANRQLVPGDVVIVPDLVLRGESGATERRHFFRRRAGPIAAIRFVHGSRHLTFANDLTLNELNVSNYVTNLAGTTGAAAFPNDTVRTFEANADADEDAFKVEVLDTRTPNRNLNVRLEALRPTYDALGIALTGHTEFVGADLAARTLNVVASKQGGTRRFRSCYLRLVVDTVDQAALPRQTLLVTDMVASGNRRVEILDHDVRATYELDTCPSVPRCLVRATVQVGRGRTVNLAVRVLRAVPTGIVETIPGGPGDNGVVTLDQIKRRIEIFCRRHWAQAHVRFNFSRLETVDLPSNMITVADATGSLASGTNPAGTGPGQVGFTIRVQRFGGAANPPPQVVPPLNVPAGSTPLQTANLIKAAIDALPGLSAVVRDNPPEVDDLVGSEDVLIFSGDIPPGRITVTNLSAIANQDSTQLVAVSNLSLIMQRRNFFNDYHVGHPEQRNLYKMLDTGDQVIDIFVLSSMPGLAGLTVPEQNHLNANRRLVSGMMNTIVLARTAADGPQADGSFSNPYALAHEIGHALLDDGLHADNLQELMQGGFLGPPLGTAQAMPDPKRLIGRNPAAANWDQMQQNPDGTLAVGRLQMNAVARVQATSADLLN